MDNVIKQKRFKLKIHPVLKHLVAAIAAVLVGERKERRWEDGLEPETDGMLPIAANIAFMLADMCIMAVLGGVILAFVLYFSIMVLGHPAFLAGALADLLVWFCRSGASCDFQVLYPAFGFANIFLLSIWIIILTGFRRSVINDHDDAVLLGERLEDLSNDMETLKRERWIAVKQARPEERTEVWACYKTLTFPAWHEGNTWYTHGEEEPEEVNVEYWMPMPQPVEVEQK